MSEEPAAGEVSLSEGIVVSIYFSYTGENSYPNLFGIYAPGNINLGFGFAIGDDSSEANALRNLPEYSALSKTETRWNISDFDIDAVVNEARRNGYKVSLYVDDGYTEVSFLNENNVIYQEYGEYFDTGWWQQFRSTAFSFSYETDGTIKSINYTIGCVGANSGTAYLSYE